MAENLANNAAANTAGNAAEDRPTPRKRAKAAKAPDQPAQGPAKKAKPARKAAPLTKPAMQAATKKAAEPPAAPVTGGPHPGVPGAWWAATWEALAKPDQPPLRLAELAVAELGPRAAAWAEWLRQTYPQAPAGGIARLATRQAGRAARAVVLAGIGGPLTAAFRLPATAWVRATVVLRIAAAYGRDPADPARAPELLEVLGLGPTTTGDPEADGAAAPGGRIGALLRRLEWLPVAIPPRLGRPTPRFALQLLATLGEQSDRVERLAHRAVRYYGRGSQSSTAANARSSSSP